jgi:hypothetical protein
MYPLVAMQKRLQWGQVGAAVSKRNVDDDWLDFERRRHVKQAGLPLRHCAFDQTDRSA